MKIFITGASGSVGKALIKDLLKERHEVYGLARSEKAAQMIGALGARPVRGDLCAVKAFKHNLWGIDAIIHAGAKVKFHGRLDEFYETNVKASNDLIEAAIESGVKKFIYISAAVVVLDGHPLIDLTERYEPENKIENGYIVSKILAENAILRYKDKIKIVIFRPPVIWGRGMRIMEEFRETIEKMGFPTIGNKHHHLATCHTNNLDAAISLAINNEKATGIYLINDNEKVEVRKFMKELTKGYGMEMGDLHIPKKLASLLAATLESLWKTFHLKGDPPLTRFIVQLMGTEFTIDDTKARRELGYRPKISVEEGLNQLVDKK